MGVRFATTEDRTAVLDQIVARAEDASLRLTPIYDRAVPDDYLRPDGSNRFQPADRVTYSSQDILDAEHRLLDQASTEHAPVLTARLIARHTSRKIKGVRLAPDQTAAVAAIARSGLNLDLMVGPAGAGKTTALRALHRAWTAAHGKDSVIGLAPSAAAAEVLGDSLGIRAENTAKFLYEHGKDRWNLRAGQLVLIDEASLAGTLALDRITAHAAQVGAKVVLIGDWAQLSAVETGGAFGMLVRHRRKVPELTDVRRFTHEWEKTASLALRHGNPAILDTYEENGRLHDGSLDTMLDAVYQAWQADRAAGLSTLMIAGNGETVAELNQRARADLVTAGRVQAEGVALHDGTTAGVGDLVVTRRNDRRLTTSGRGWVKNGDRWQVTRSYDDGSLAVRRLGEGDTPYGAALVLPAGYVGEDLELGYASTVHRAQGATVDTAHALVDPEWESRELLYVALTRGRHANHAYVIQSDPHEVEPHLDQPEPQTVTEQLARVLARSDADLSATETLTLEADRHASLSTLLAEYDLLAAEAQHDRWATLLDVAPFAENVADDVFTSPYYEHLEAALARHEAEGHNITAILTALAPDIGPGEDQTDPAARLATLIDDATARLPQRRAARRRVAGLIPTPAEPVPADMQKALTQRETLITAAARHALHHDLDTGEAWTTRIGRPDTNPRTRAAWLAHATTIALYRQRYEVTATAPLGNPKDIHNAQQAAEYRAARAALDRARTIGQTTPDTGRPGLVLPPDRSRQL